jgi:hypothetical protein
MSPLKEFFLHSGGIPAFRGFASVQRFFLLPWNFPLFRAIPPFRGCFSIQGFVPFREFPPLRVLPSVRGFPPTLSQRSLKGLNFPAVIGYPIVSRIQALQGAIAHLRETISRKDFMKSSVSC